MFPPLKHKMDINGIYSKLFVTKLTIVHAEENHSGIRRGFGAQGRKSPIDDRIRFCDPDVHFTFDWKWGERETTQLQAMTTREQS